MYSVSVFAARLSNVYINHTVYILARRTSQSSPQALYNWMHLIKAWLVWFHGKLHGGMLSKEGFIWRDCSSYQCDLRQLSTKHALCSGCISNMSLSLRFLLWNCIGMELKCQNLCLQCAVIWNAIEKLKKYITTTELGTPPKCLLGTRRLSIVTEIDI